jgi:hypothetical protein
MRHAFFALLLTSASCMAEGPDDVGVTQDESHAWGNYHWAQTGPFTLKLGDSVSGPWDAVLGTTSSDWSQSTVLNTTIVAGTSTTKKCRATAGRVEVCSNTYGRNQWLGIAQIWASGSHITQGTVRLNDSYLGAPPYNTTAWRNLVSCQEVGHTLGLDHQDENFSNTPLGTCMDYSNDPEPNQHPNRHDYDMLEDIYGHDDGSTTVASMPDAIASAELSTPGSWGHVVASDAGGRHEVYVRDFGGGYRVITHVLWAD